MHDEESIFFIFGGEMGHAGLAAVDRCAAQLFKSDFLMGDCSDHIWPSDEHMACIFHHNDEVGDGGRVDGPAGARPHNDTDLRHDTGSHDIEEEDVGVAGQAEHPFLNACATGVVETDNRSAVFHRHIQDFADFCCVMTADTATKDGKILRENIDEPVINCSIPGDDTVAGDALLVQAEVVAVVRDECVHFPKTALIQQQFESLARGRPALGVLNFDSFEAAPQLGHVLAAAQIGNTGVDCRVSQDKLLYSVVGRFAVTLGILPAARGRSGTSGVFDGPYCCRGASAEARTRPPSIPEQR